MSEVTLKINNRGYSLSCDPGQEQRIGELGHYVDSRLQDISAAGAATNESHFARSYLACFGRRAF